MSRIRADQLLVQRGIFASRAQAQAAVDAGLVKADGMQVTKAAQLIAEDAEIEAEPAHPYVSRGGLKLAAALEAFAIDPRGKICLDVGASTGGFTDVLLQSGAKRIYAVDVGTDQFHERLKHRTDIELLEKTDIRSISPGRFDPPPELVAIDVSFISLKHVLPAVDLLAATNAEMVALIKPQFEAGRKAVRKGVVRDAAVQAAVCEEIADFARSLGWTVRGLIESPIPGGEGNREFLLCAARGAAG